MDKLVKRYQAADNAELEIRFYLDGTEWQNAYQTLKSGAKKSPVKFEQSIHIIQEEGKNSNRKELYFDKGVKQEERYIRKATLEFLKYKGAKINLATEEKIGEFNTDNAKMIRFRSRASIPLTIGEGIWKAEFTIIRTLQKAQFAQLKKVKEEVFPTGKVLDAARMDALVDPSNPNLSYEFEVEYQGDPDALTTQMIEEVFSRVQNIVKPGLEESEEYHKTIYHLAKMLLDNDSSASFKHKYSLKQLANQPKNFSTDEYRDMILPHIDKYYLSDKADGDRCFLQIDPERAVLITADKIVNVTDRLKKVNWKMFKGVTVLDTEVLMDSKDLSIYVFDALYVQDKNVTNMTFEKRLEHIDEVLKYLGTNVEKKVQIRLTKDGYAQQIKEIYNRKSRMYPIDGLIFTPNTPLDDSKSKYTSKNMYFDMVVYKWKPPEKMTIDFLVMRPPKHLIGVKPYLPKDGHDIYFLFCGINYNTYKMLGLDYVTGYQEIFENYRFEQNYFPIQFAPSSNPYAYIYYHPKKNDVDLHGHVAEFRYNCIGAEQMQSPDCTWILDRMRPDRDINVTKGTGYGNDFKTAESTYLGYFSPITLQILMGEEPKVKKGKGEESDKYFAEEKQPMYRAPTKFNAFVKAQVERQLEDTEFVIDLACGKGQELFPLHGYGVQNALFVDQDGAAIETLNQRRYELGNRNYYLYSYRPNHTMGLYTKVWDLSKPYKETLKAVDDVLSKFPQGADGVIMHFAIHYLIQDAKSLDNVVNLVDTMLKKGGIFIFTCFNGQAIFDLLKDIEEGETWEVKEADTVKYSITKHYKSDELTAFGQKIAVKHPFSGDKAYEENLVNIANVIEAFTKKGYEVRQNSSFGDWLNKFQYFNKKAYAELTDDDKLYCSLYNYVSLWKPADKPKAVKSRGKKDAPPSLPVVMEMPTDTTGGDVREVVEKEEPEEFYIDDLEDED